MISKGWNCFAVNSQKNLIHLYDRVTIVFLFVTVNVISPLPRCSSCLAPFCFMKNSNAHACIVFALSFYAGKTSTDIENILGSEVQQIAHWLNDNNLVINLKKSKPECVLYGTHQNHLNRPHLKSSLMD